MCSSMVYVIGEAYVGSRLSVVKFAGGVKAIHGFLPAQGIGAPHASCIVQGSATNGYKFMKRA